MEAIELSDPSEPESIKQELQEEFADEMAEERRELEQPFGRDNIQYSQEFADALIANVRDYLWEQWSDELPAEGIEEEDFAQLMSLTTSVLVFWIYGDTDWDYVLKEVDRKFEKADMLLDAA